MKLIGLRRLAAVALMGTLAAFVGACGGGSGAGAQGTGPVEGGDGTGGGAIGGGTSVSQVQLVTKNSSTLPTDGGTPVELEAYVIDANNNAMVEQAVTFAAADEASPSGIRLQVNDGGVTDSSGRASAQLLLSGNSTNRAVTVVARVGSVSSLPLTVDVNGTSLAISGPSAITQAAATATDYTVVLRNSAGSGVAGQSLSVKSRVGNDIEQPTVVTNASGQAIVRVRGTVPGSDTLTITGAGASDMHELTVSDRSLMFATNSLTEVPIGPAGGTFTINYGQLNGIPPGTMALLHATRGIVAPSSVDISSGTASFQVNSPFAGPATLLSKVGDVTATLPLTFYSTVPGLITLQPSPQILAANVGSATEQRSALHITVRDVNGNPVRKRNIAINAQDPSGGSIQPPFVVTDASGMAEATFVAGRNFTAPNAVVLVARDIDAGLESPPAALTVTRRELFVRFHTDNRVEKVDSPPVYRKRFSVIVTDSAGNGVPNAQVQAKLVPTRYREGVWTPGLDGWVQQITGTLPSEDLGYDGVCSTVAEDANGDGYLTPGNVASVSGSSQTEPDGVGELVVSYPQGFAEWVETILEVTVRSGGTESQSAQRFWLPIAASDVSSLDVSPPGQTSPFPYAASPGLSVASCPST